MNHENSKYISKTTRISFDGKLNEQKSYEKLNITVSDVNIESNIDANPPDIKEGTINEPEPTKLIKQINIELNRVEKNLEALEGLKSIAIDRLEEQKHELRENISKGVASNTNLNDFIKTMRTMDQDEKDFLIKAFLKADENKIVNSQAITDVIHELDM